MGLFQQERAVTDLQYQQPVVAQVIAGIEQQSGDQRQVVGIAMKGKARFVQILRRQTRPLVTGDIRRIAHDQVETLGGQPVEQIGLDVFDLRTDIVLVAVDARDIERIGTGVGGDHARLWKCQRTGNGDRATAGTQIQNRQRLAMPQPGLELGFDQLCDGRTRHDHALVDEEFEPGKPGLAGDVGRRLTTLDTALDDRDHRGTLRGRQRGVEIGIGHFRAQAQRIEHQVGGLVDGVVAAVAEGELGRNETRRPPADVVENPRKRAGDFVVVVVGHTCSFVDGVSAPAPGASARAATLLQVANFENAHTQATGRAAAQLG